MEGRPDPSEEDIRRGDVFGKALHLLEKSHFQSDRAFGFRILLQIPDHLLPPGQSKDRIRGRIREAWKEDPIALEEYIRILSSVDADPEALAYIRELLDQEILFNPNLAGHARTLARNTILHRRRTLLTTEGRELLTEVFLRIGRVNQMSVYDILASFDDLPAFRPETREALLETLQNMRKGLDPKKEQSLFNQLNRILKPYEGKDE